MHRVNDLTLGLALALAVCAALLSMPNDGPAVAGAMRWMLAAQALAVDAPIVPRGGQLFVSP